MGIPLKINSTQFIVFACLLLALLCANMNRASCFSNIDLEITVGWGNGTTGGAVEYVDADDDDEFLMESEISRRILEGNNKKTFVYPTLKQEAFCDDKGRIANCESLRVNNHSRPCTIEGRCQRHI